jgi:hypothetical protein
MRLATVSGAGSSIVRVGGAWVAPRSQPIQPIQLFNAGIARSYGDNNVNGNATGETFSGLEPKK